MLVSKILGILQRWVTHRAGESEPRPTSGSSTSGTTSGPTSGPTRVDFPCLQPFKDSHESSHETSHEGVHGSVHESVQSSGRGSSVLFSLVLFVGQAQGFPGGPKGRNCLQWGRSNLVDPADWPKIGLLNWGFGSSSFCHLDFAKELPRFGQKISPNLV